MSLKISSILTLPMKTVTDVNAFLAKRGAGKTYSASVLAEEMLKAGIPIVVIDGMGIWWGLRVDKDKKSNGLPIVVFGGEYQDLPLSPDKAKQLARAIVESNISCVLDLSGFSKTQSKKIVADFIDELYKINRTERHVFIEEADMWAPQRSYGPDEALCLGSMINFVRRGGNHNLGASVITQRSAALSKDILTQADTLVILRTLAPQDKRAIQFWVEEMTDEDKKKLGKWFDSLKELENGEAWVWHPEKPTVYKKIQFRERETFHATRENLSTPEASRIQLMNVDDFISKFKAVFEPKPKALEIVKQVSIPIHTIEKPVSVPPPINKYEPTYMLTPQHPPEPKTAWGNVAKTEGTRTIPDFSIIADDIHLQQAKPMLVIEQYKPQLQIPVELLDQPSTALGKLVVILKNDPNNLGKWTIQRMVKDIQDHGWDAAELGDAVKQLLAWEILTKGHDGNYMKVHLNRIQIVDRTEGLGVQ